MVRDLILSGDGAGDYSRSWGIFLYNDVDDVVLENLVIENFDIAINLVSSKGSEGCERITLRNSRIVNNRKQGWLGGSSGSVIEGNHFENNGFGARSSRIAVRRHNLYFSESSTGAVIRGNTLHRASQYDHDGRRRGPPLHRRFPVHLQQSARRPANSDAELQNAVSPSQASPERSSGPTAKRIYRV